MTRPGNYEPREEWKEEEEGRPAVAIGGPSRPPKGGISLLTLLQISLRMTAPISIAILFLPFFFIAIDGEVDNPVSIIRRAIKKIPSSRALYGPLTTIANLPALSCSFCSSLSISLYFPLYKKGWSSECLVDPQMASTSLPWLLQPFPPLLSLFLFSSLFFSLFTNIPFSCQIQLLLRFDMS